MTLEEAIRLKEKYQHVLPKECHPDLLEADNLSIEALKAVIECRASHMFCPGLTMPGETEE